MRRRTANCVADLEPLSYEHESTTGRRRERDLHSLLGRPSEQRLERLAESTGRSRSSLAAEAIARYLDANEWQVEGVQAAIDSMDAGEGLAHEAVRRWVESWDS